MTIQNTIEYIYQEIQKSRNPEIQKSRNPIILLICNMKLSLQNNDSVDNEELFNSENHIMQINDILRLYQIELFRNITEFQLNFNFRYSHSFRIDF